MSGQSHWTQSDPKLHYVDWGEGSGARGGAGTPLLLTHGRAANTHWWDPVIPHLADALHPIAMDFRGHGESSWTTEGYYSTEGLIHDIESVRKALGWERMVLGGHSMGARVAVGYACRYPERLWGLIATDFLPDMSKSKRWLKAASPRTGPQPYYTHLEAILQRFQLVPPGTLLDGDGLRALAQNCLRKTEKGFTWKFDWRALRFIYEPVWELLAKVTVPTLVLRGEHSTVMTRGMYEEVLRLIPGVQGIELVRAHHHVTLDAPREVARHLLDFVKGLPVR